MWNSRWSDQQIASFSFKLHHLLEAGLPLMDALKLVRHHWPKRRMTDYTLLLSSLQEGQPLTHALKRIRFPPFYIFLLMVGEQHGQLSDSLKMASMYYQKRHHQKRKQHKALAYPLLLLASVLCTLFIFLQFLLPQFLSLYHTFNVPLPAVTRWTVILMESPLIPWVSLGGIMLFLLIVRMIRHQRMIWEKVLFKLPLISYYFRLQQTYLVCVQAGLLLEGGVTILRVCKLFQNEGVSLFVQQTFSDILDKLYQGEALSRVFEGRPCFLPVLHEMVLIAEQSGTLGASLLRVGEQLESELEDWIEKLSLFFESFITIGAGSLVLFLMLVLFVPLYHLINYI